MYTSSNWSFAESDWIKCSLFECISVCHKVG